MPAIPMYLLGKDVEFLNDWINQEEELAFLMSNGEKRWIANREHDMLTEMKTQPLPGLNLMMPDYRKFATHIPRGNTPGATKEIYAFPSAYEEIRNGRPCSIY